jgi:8-oxo-dGTP pyrophosphatase MutT (NUDIX family)
MAESPVPTTVFTASEFLLLGGSILFRNVPRATPESGIDSQLEVCLLYHPGRDAWLLPKGRKDQDEDLKRTAVRETFEETGYPCELLPLAFDTRAPAPGIHVKDRAARVERCTEPFTLSVRHVSTNDVKITAWFATVCTGEKQEGTMMPTETYESAFFGVEEALGKVTYRDDRDIVARAIQLVRETYCETPGANGDEVVQ